MHDILMWLIDLTALLKTFIIFRITIQFNGTNLGPRGYHFMIMIFFYKLLMPTKVVFGKKKYSKNMDIVITIIIGIKTIAFYLKYYLRWPSWIFSIQNSSPQLKKTFLIIIVINVENSCAASYFCGNIYLSNAISWMLSRGVEKHCYTL